MDVVEFVITISVLAFLFLGVPAGVWFLLVVADEGVPEWVRLPVSKKKHRRQVLEYIEWERAKDMRRYPSIYPSESEWNERELAHKVRTYDHYARKRMLAERGDTELMQWVMKNDPSVLKSRIQQLEKELEIK